MCRLKRLNPHQNILWCLGLSMVPIHNFTQLNAWATPSGLPFFSFNDKLKLLENLDTTISLNTASVFLIPAVLGVPHAISHILCRNTRLYNFKKLSFFAKKCRKTIKAKTPVTSSYKIIHTPTPYTTHTSLSEKLSDTICFSYSLFMIGKSSTNPIWWLLDNLAWAVYFGGDSNLFTIQKQVKNYWTVELRLNHNKPPTTGSWGW